MWGKVLRQYTISLFYFHSAFPFLNSKVFLYWTTLYFYTRQNKPQLHVAPKQIYFDITVSEDTHKINGNCFNKEWCVLIADYFQLYIKRLSFGCGTKTLLFCFCRVTAASVTLKSRMSLHTFISSTPTYPKSPRGEWATCPRGALMSTSVKLHGKPSKMEYLKSCDCRSWSLLIFRPLDLIWSSQIYH